MPTLSNISIERKIEATTSEISALVELDDSSCVKSLMIGELQRRLARLTEERERIIEAEAREIVDLYIYGDRIESGKISNRILISVLNGFQEMADTMANFVVKSSISESDRNTRELRTYIKSLTDFNIIDTYAGSFGIVLEKDYGQIGLMTSVTQENKVLDDMFKVLESSQDLDCLVETIVPYGKRAITHYKEWIRNIEDNDINLELKWIDSSAEKRKVNIKKSMASNIIATLNSIETIETLDVDVVGILTGINIRKNSFEMKAEDGAIIKGKSSIETLIASSNYMSQRIIAQLTKSTIYSRDGIPKENWYLKESKELCIEE